MRPTMSPRPVPEHGKWPVTALAGARHPLPLPFVALHFHATVQRRHRVVAVQMTLEEPKSTWIVHALAYWGQGRGNPTTAMKRNTVADYYVAGEWKDALQRLRYRNRQVGPFVLITGVVKDRVAIQAAHLAGPFLPAGQDLIGDPSMSASPHRGDGALRMRRSNSLGLFHGHLHTLRRNRQLIHMKAFQNL